MSTFQEQQIREARENIRRQEEAERARIAKLVKQASESTRAFVAEREAAERLAELERQQAQQERERERLARVEADARRAARLAWMGDDQSFDVAWPQIWQRYQIDQAAAALADGRAAARGATRRAF